MGRASSSLAFLRFCSASSEDLGQSRVRGAATAPQHHLPHPHPTHARKSFTSSTVMSPVVSSGFSMLLLGESMGPGEKVAECSSGDPGESGDRRHWGQPGRRAGLAAGLWDTVCVQGQGGHPRSLSEGECWLSELRGTWVPFACGSFGVTVELLLEGNREKLWLEPVSWGGCRGVPTQQSPPRPRDSPPEAGGVLEPGDLQPAQWLRHIPGAQREALKLGWRD